MFIRPLKRPPAGRGFLRRAALCAALTLCVASCGCQRLVSSPSPLPAPSPAPVASETDTKTGGKTNTQKTNTRKTNAKTNLASSEWERSVRAGYIVPIRARVVVSRWADKNGAKENRTEMEIVTDGAGRYRHTYVTPGSGAGRVILSDSRTNYQYEPTRNAVLRRPEISPEPSEIASPTHLTHAFVGAGTPESAPLLGRPTRLILSAATRENRSTYIWEKRWVDAATGRSLKTETYAPSGRLVRRFEITRVSFPAAVPQKVFRPNFPANARTIAAATPLSKSAFAEAARLGLPREAQGFRLQSAARSLAARTGTKPATHLIYSDGTRTISLFVADMSGAPLPSPLPAPEWRSVPLPQGVTAYVRRSRDNAHTLLVWVSDNRRYTAVSQLPLEDWLPAARAFVGGGQ